MYPVSSAYLEALRVGGRGRYGYVEAYYNDTLLTFTGPDGITTSRLPLRSDATNQVTVDGANAGPRRVISLTLAPLPDLWEMLAPIGTELRAYTVLGFTDGTSETVPQGVFVIDVQRMGYGSTGDLQITAPDRWQKIADTEYLVPRVSDAGLNVRVQIAQLINVVYPSLLILDTATSTVQVPPQVWDSGGIGKTIRELAKSAALDVGFERTGAPFIRDAPTLADSASWTVDAGATGVLMAAERERNRQRTYNIIKVTSPANAEGGDLFDPVFVWDNNPSSPTFAGSGSGADTTPPLASSAGPFGQRMLAYSSPLLTDQTQAIAAGRVLLEKTTALAAQLTLTAAPNPALDDGDTILVVLPSTKPPAVAVTSTGGFGVGSFGTMPFGLGAGSFTEIVTPAPGPTERHIVDKLTIPLTPKGAQSIDTRSTVADIDEVVA